MILWLKIALFAFKRCIRSRSEIIVSIGFIVSFSALSGLGMGPEAFERPEIGVGLLWLSLLLSLALVSPSFVARDEEQGALVQMQLLPLSHGSMLLAKALGVFCGSILPLLLALPLVGVIYGLNFMILAQSALFLILGGWCYWLLLAIASLLLLGSARAAALQLLITLPLGVPLLIFGCAASLRDGAALENAVILLGALALAFTAMAPWVMGFLLQQYRRS